MSSLLQQAVPAVVQDVEFGEAVRCYSQGGGGDLPAPAGALRHSRLRQGQGGHALPQLAQPQQLSLAEPAPRHGGCSRAEPVAAGLLQQICMYTRRRTIFLIASSHSVVESSAWLVAFRENKGNPTMVIEITEN